MTKDSTIQSVIRPLFSIMCLHYPSPQDIHCAISPTSKQAVYAPIFPLPFCHLLSRFLWNVPSVECLANCKQKMPDIGISSPREPSLQQLNVAHARPLVDSFCCRGRDGYCMLAFLDYFEWQIPPFPSAPSSAVGISPRSRPVRAT